MQSHSLLLAYAFSLVAATVAAQGPVDPNFVVGKQSHEPLASLNLERKHLGKASDEYRFGYKAITKYLNDTQAVVTGTFDDSGLKMLPCMDALDKYGVKASLAVHTAHSDMDKLWPRLREAVDQGHEVASHSRRHPCEWESTRGGTAISREFCRSAYNHDELIGSRNDILANTQQPYVWAFVYPCGNCAAYDFIHRRLADVGYLAARAYPNETKGGALQPGLETWAYNPYNATYTQAIQKDGGVAPAGMTNVKVLNEKFDKVIAAGGIYHMVSHPAWLDYGEEAFFEQHLKHIGGREDVWYVPFGPLYAYRTLVEHTAVIRLTSKDGSERFAVAHDLDPEIYSMALTIKFTVPQDESVTVTVGDRTLAERAADRMTDRWDEEYVRRDEERIFVTLLPPAIVSLR